MSAKRREVSVKAGVHVIKPSESVRLLGGQLHESLRWNLHIRDHKASLLNQLISRINGLKKLCVNASFRTRLMVANGVVISKLTYLIILWGGARQYLINMLQVQQMTAARIVCGAGSWRLSRKQLLSRTGWLSVKQLFYYHSVLQVYKTLRNGAPRSLFLSLTCKYPRETRIATAGNIRQISRCGATFTSRASQFYNSVPVDVRTGSLPAVKSKLKKWITLNIPID